MEECRKFGSYTGCVAACLMSMLWADRESTETFDEILQNIEEYLTRINFKDHSDKSQETYERRLIDLFEDMANYGYI